MAPFAISTLLEVSLIAPMVLAWTVIWLDSIFICGEVGEAPTWSVMSLEVSLMLESPILMVMSLSVIFISAPSAVCARGETVCTIAAACRPPRSRRRSITPERLLSVR